MARRVPECVLPLVRQVSGRDRATVRRGEHPRGEVRRLDLLGDDELDRFRALHPEGSVVALDSAVALEETLEAALRARGLAAQLEALPMRPVLATFVCFACGAAAIGEDLRAWDVDREMQRTGRSEREVLRERAASGTAAQRRALGRRPQK